MSTVDVASVVSAGILPYLAGGLAAVTTFALLSRKLAWSPTHKNGVPLPPGPSTSWFWQNSHPTKDAPRALAALVDQYGPIVSLRNGSHVTVIIGRMDAATEIMEKEGAALADRPRMISIAELYSGGLNLLFVPAGERFRRLRRAVHTHLQPKAAETYQGIQVEAAKDVILDILNDPKLHIQHAQRYSASVILRVVYGKKSSTSTDDPEVVRIHQSSANFESALAHGAYLVDRFSWLRYVPGYGHQLKGFHQFELSLFRDQLDRVREDMSTNNADPSFGKSLLENIDDHRLSNDEMAYLAGTLFGAASDTTSSAISVMVMAAAWYPDAQARVQEELDNIVGKGRVPTFTDKDNLPQLQAFILEALRLRPVTPVGFSHRATKDIIWKGQCIPSGATVLGCHWAISRDPVAFPDPEKFDPQRWITEEGQIRRDINSYTYGFGRRVCPGQHVANRSLYINAALLLWSFRIMERPDAPIDPASGFNNPIIFHPDPFEVEFVPRVEERRLRQLLTSYNSDVLLSNNAL